MQQNVDLAYSECFSDDKSTYGYDDIYDAIHQVVNA